MICEKCKEEKEIHARKLCRKCYDAEPDFRAKRMVWHLENKHTHFSAVDVLRMVMR